MTICIGTICANGKIAILATDRMVTSLGLSVEFEHESKIQRITKNCLVVTSGDASVHEEILNPVIKKYQHIKLPLISQINEDIKKEYCNLRIRIIEENLFKPRGLTITDYYKRQNDFSENFASTIEDYIESEEIIELDLILAGVDINGAHLFYITDPGTSRPYTALGFCSIGSGEPHAENSLIANHFSKRMTLKEAMYLTYEAKKRAQIAPGVGEYTNMAYVDKDACYFISDETIKMLNVLFEKKEKDVLEPLREMMATMTDELIITSNNIE